MPPPEDNLRQMPLRNPRPEQLTRIVIRPIGSSLPIGFFAFGVGTALLACLELGVLGPNDQHTMCLVLLAFVSPLELMACVFAYFARDAAGATAMGIFGASWLPYAIHQLSSPASSFGRSLSVMYFMAAIIMLCLAIVARKGKPMLAIILVIAATRSLCGGLIQWGFKGSLYVVAAVLGFILTAFSIYGGLAFLMEDVEQRTVLPVFRKGKAKQSMEGGLQEQLERVAQEAGVRQQL